VGDLFGGHCFDQFSAPLLDHFWPPEWSQNPQTIDGKLLPHSASIFTSFMAHFCPPLASESERCWAQNLDFSLAFAIYYANRLFSFLVVSASSFAPPPLGSILAHKTSDTPPKNASKHVPRFIQISSIVLPRFGSMLEPMLASLWHHFSLKCHNRNQVLWPFSCLAPFSAPGLAKVSP
jgi:hypothetical protein